MQNNQEVIFRIIYTFLFSTYCNYILLDFYQQVLMLHYLVWLFLLVVLNDRAKCLRMFFLLFYFGYFISLLYEKEVVKAKYDYNFIDDVGGWGGWYFFMEGCNGGFLFIGGFCFNRQFVKPLKP